MRIDFLLRENTFESSKKKYCVTQIQLLGLRYIWPPTGRNSERGPNSACCKKKKQKNKKKHTHTPVKEPVEWYRLS